MQSFVNNSRTEICNSSLCRELKNFDAEIFFFAGVGTAFIVSCPEVNNLSRENVHLFHQNILGVMPVLTVIRKFDFSCRHLTSEMMQESK